MCWWHIIISQHQRSIFHTWNYLELCSLNVIVINDKKFQFCKQTVTFSRLTITPSAFTPSDNILSGIKDFTTPKDLTDARSWFGLVNQVTWAYSLSDIMKPFRNLIKPNNKFNWNAEFDKIFRDSKSILISMVKHGIHSFDTSRHTCCIQSDWSKDGIGYVVLQQYCQCPANTAPTCCSGGWHLAFAGSRFTTLTESRYAPIEGEALAVAWVLNNAKIFVLGCKHLIVITGHKLLLNIFNHTDLSTITNPRILKPKNASPFSTVQENGTKLQMQSHEIPHILTIAFIFTTNTMATEPSAEYISDADTIENTLNATCDISLAGINITNTDSSDQPHCIIYLMVVNECQSDEQYQLFAEFPMMGGHPPPPSYDFFWKPLHQNRCPHGAPPLPLKNEAPPHLKNNPPPHWNMKHPSMKWFLEKAQ